MAVVLQGILTVVLFPVLERINLLLFKACAKFQMLSMSNFFCLLLMQGVLLVFCFWKVFANHRDRLQSQHKRLPTAIVFRASLRVPSCTCSDAYVHV